MRFQLILLLLFSGNSVASSDKEMNELFKKYDQVMDQKKVDLVDEIFSKKFLESSGGKQEFIKKVKTLPTEKSIERKLTWRKGLKSEMFYAKQLDPKKNESSSEFIIVKENGKLKIQGTIGDAE